MGWVTMSERELNRVEVLAQVDDGRLTVANAANMLGLTRRQVFRLLKRYRQDGASAIRHKSRGRAPNNQIHSAKRDYALTGCCHVNSPNLQVGKLFVDQAACAADFHASNASSRW